MSQRWRAVGNIASDLTGPEIRDLNLDLSIQRRTCYRSTNWPVKCKVLTKKCKKKCKLLTKKYLSKRKKEVVSRVLKYKYFWKYSSKINKLFNRHMTIGRLPLHHCNTALGLLTLHYHNKSWIIFAFCKFFVIIFKTINQKEQQQQNFVVRKSCHAEFTWNHFI